MDSVIELEELQESTPTHGKHLVKTTIKNQLTTSNPNTWVDIKLEPLFVSGNDKMHHDVSFRLTDLNGMDSFMKEIGNQDYILTPLDSLKSMVQAPGLRQC